MAAGNLILNVSALESASMMFPVVSSALVARQIKMVGYPKALSTCADRI